MRCVQEEFQSGVKEAPISTIFSLSSVLKGFLNPLRENTTPLCSSIYRTEDGEISLALALSARVFMWTTARAACLSRVCI